MRGQNFYALLRCPATGAPLTRDEASHLLTSEAESTLTYRQHDEIVYLVTPAQQQRLEAAEVTSKAEMQRKKWAAPTTEDFRRLPQTALPDWPADYWQLRADATGEMWRVLEQLRREKGQLPIGSMGVAADFSDGMGWLGYGLDVSGYNTLVLSENKGEYGLGVLPSTRYMRVWGTLETPPLAPHSFDLITFSFSLETMDNPALALQHATALLKDNGIIIVLSAQQLQQDILVTPLQDAGLDVSAQPVRGLGNTLSRTVNRLRSLSSGNISSPPLIVAHKR